MGVSKWGLSSVLLRSSGFIEAFRPGPHPPPTLRLSTRFHWPKNWKFHWFYKVFGTFRFFFDLGAILDHHGLQDASENSQEHPRAAQEPPKSAQEAPKSRPRAPKSRPRAPRVAQEPPKSAQEPPKSRPKASQEPSNSAQQPPKSAPFSSRLPSPGQVQRYAGDVLSAMAQHDGLLPRPWPFTKGGLAVSARQRVFDKCKKHIQGHLGPSDLPRVAVQWFVSKLFEMVRNCSNGWKWFEI